MREVEQGFEVLTPISQGAQWELALIEQAARTCYKSEDKAGPGSDRKLIRGLIQRGHESVLEHSVLSVKLICDRATSHQIVRHRLASFSQESQRYCNYSGDKFTGEVTFVKPGLIARGTEAYDIWRKSCEQAEEAYFKLLGFGLNPEEARSVLPNSTKTELVITANYREWRHIFDVRCDVHAQYEIQTLMTDLVLALHKLIPVIFDDLVDF